MSPLLSKAPIITWQHQTWKWSDIRHEISHNDIIHTSTTFAQQQTAHTTFIHANDQHLHIRIHTINTDQHKCSLLTQFSHSLLAEGQTSAPHPQQPSYLVNTVEHIDAVLVPAEDPTLPEETAEQPELSVCWTISSQQIRTRKQLKLRNLSHTRGQRGKHSGRHLGHLGQQWAVTQIIGTWLQQSCLLTAEEEAWCYWARIYKWKLIQDLLVHFQLMETGLPLDTTG